MKYTSWFIVAGSVACAMAVWPDRTVLNPYTSYEEMGPICRMIVQKDPQVVCQRDGFKLAPLETCLCQGIKTWFYC